MAICTGSEPLSLRVRLLSIPQARQAAAMKAAPGPTPAGPPCQDRTTAPARMAEAPASRRRSTFSRKTS